MSSIVDELLLLAEVRKVEEVETKPLDMANIVVRARERLTHIIEKHQAEIILPAVWTAALGHAPWVEEVWVNYLSNAIKYGGQPPRIELGATPSQSPPPGGGRAGEDGALLGARQRPRPHARGAGTVVHSVCTARPGWHQGAWIGIVHRAAHRGKARWASRGGE